MAEQQVLPAAERIAPYAAAASIQAALASCAYLIYALWVTWPMPAHLTSSIYGPGGDVTGAMAMWRELAQNAVPFVPGTIDPRPDNILLGGTDFGLRGGLVREGNLYFYVGLVVAALAAVALLLALTRRAPRPGRDNVLIVGWLGFVALVWSGPPTAQLGAVALPLPSDLVSELTTTWRIYGRFGIVVSFAVCLLAAYGLAGLVRDRRSGVRAFLLAVAALLVFLDFREPRLEVTRIVEPGIYAALEDRPPGAVAEYPLVPAGYSVHEQIFNQDYRGRQVVNGYREGTSAEARALMLARLDDPETPARLRSLGVGYVVLDTALYEVSLAR